MLQLLYTFYESRTHIHILFDELLYRDTSRYVDYKKKQAYRNDGLRLSSKKMIETAFPDPTKIDDDEKDQIRRLCFFILYTLNILIACIPS